MLSQEQLDQIKVDIETLGNESVETRILSGHIKELLDDLSGLELSINTTSGEHVCDLTLDREQATELMNVAVSRFVSEAIAMHCKV